MVNQRRRLLIVWSTNPPLSTRPVMWCKDWRSWNRRWKAVAKNGAFWLQQTVIHIMNMLQSKSCTKLTRDQCVRSFCDASTASGTQSVHSLIITRSQCEQKRCTIAHIAVLAQPSCSQSHSLTVEQCVRASVHEDSHPPTDAQFAELHIEDSHADRGASWLVTWSEISQVGQPTKSLSTTSLKGILKRDGPAVILPPQFTW